MRLKETMVVPRLILVIVSVVMLAWAYFLHQGSHDRGAVTVLVIYAVVILAGLALEFWRYRPNVDERHPGWEPTDEKFVDPVTGEPVQVWFNPKTGQRDYRPVS